MAPEVEVEVIMDLEVRTEMPKATLLETFLGIAIDSKGVDY